MAGKKKIVLCMIVKNEAKVIERCLASMLPVIDTWCIVDTGSTDGTQEKIKKFFEQVGIEGKLHELSWKGFGASRSEALELARPMGDYSWMIDADEILEFEPNFDPDKMKESLDKDLYNVFAFYNGVKYHRPQLTGNHLEFYYRGVLHEYVDCKTEIKTRDFVPGVINRPIQDGARNQDPEKYKKDAELLEKTLAAGGVDEKDFNRYHFYLAQSYRDAGMYEEALKWYTKRAELGGWNEEVFYSLFQCGCLMQIMNKPVDDIVKMFFNAYQAAPFRAESLWAAARLCRVACRWDQGYHLAKMASKIQYPNGGLFVSQHVYDWCILDELAISAYYTGRYQESLKSCVKLLSENKFTPDNKQRIEANYQFAMKSIVEENN